MTRGTETASYRIQLTPEFPFSAAAARCDYLARLGVDVLYLSPIFEATPGSMHGYDVTDPRRVRGELGGMDGLRDLVATARDRQLSILLDIVPNHVAASSENPWWTDLLEHGPDARSARIFDVDWRGGRVVLPVLGEPPDQAQFEIRSRDDGAALHYFDQHFPLRDDRPVPEPGSYPGAALRDLLAAQHYELTYWREGLSRINYRRFFDIAGLAAVRQEDPWVFDRSHEGVARLCDAGLIDGVRVDHVDGLRDPFTYLRRLRELVGDRLLLVEKILARDESLPPEWPVDGTTGYEFAAATLDLLVPEEGYRKLHRYAALEGDLPPSYHAELVTAKTEMAEALFAAELDKLVEKGSRLRKAPAGADLRRAIVALSAQLPVYRTYADEKGFRPADRQVIQAALAGARATASGPALDWLGDLLLEGPTDEALDWTLDWQQFTAPLMAKGGEDTAHYRHIVVAAMNEVGSEPEAVPDRLRATHQRLRQRRGRSLNTTASHDTKRGEDTRARMAMIAQQPEPFLRLAEVLGEHWSDLRSSDALLLLQTLVGVYNENAAEILPRLQAYSEKAFREAKRDSHWHAVDEDYEGAAHTALARLLEEPAATAQLQALRECAAHYALPGIMASLVQTTLKLTAPGIPDIYQGAELWDFSLVDPDNRRPVDFDHRERLLTALDRSPLSTSQIETMLRQWPDGRIKLWLIARLLDLRRAHRSLFAQGDYRPLELPRGWFGFERRHHSLRMQVLTRNQLMEPCPAAAFELASGHWCSMLDGRDWPAGRVALNCLAGPLPVIVLMPEGTAAS